MHANRFSFQNLLQVTQTAKEEDKNNRGKRNVHQQNYKQKYLECKQNVKKFMQLVEKQFDQLTKSHNKQRSQLKKQVQNLKRQIQQKNNEISNFSISSKKFTNVNSNSNLTKRNHSQQFNNTQVVSFDDIEGFDLSKIHFKNKGLVQRNLSSSSAANSFFQLGSDMKQRKCSKDIFKNALNPNNSTQNDIKNEFIHSQPLSYRTAGQSKIRTDKVSKVNSVVQNCQVLTEKIRSNQNVNQESFSNQNKPHQIRKMDVSTKKNKQNESQNNNKERIFAQQNSVHNVLKNLRNTMRTNIERQSKLEAPSIIILKS